MLVNLKLFLVVLNAFAIAKRVSGNNKICDKDIGSVQDMPLKTDLHGYLSSLTKTMKYCNKYRSDINVNLAFGLFLLNVNLKRCLKTKNIPFALKIELHSLIEDNDNLFRYFKHRQHTDTMSLINNISMMELFWVNRIERFKPVQSKKPLFESGPHAGRSDPVWTDYLHRMLDFERWTPNPKLSDFCIGSLLPNPVKTSEIKCNVSNICQHMLENGTNFGYALTHRLLFLLHARYGRGCSVFSPKTDKRIRHEFCERAYEEAKFIAVHDYDYIDLLLEQMALCTLDGNSKFLHRSWLTRLLLHQVPHGCFGEYPQLDHNRLDVQLFKLDVDFVEGACNGHVTGVAAAALGAAVRFIVEMYY